MGFGNWKNTTTGKDLPICQAMQSFGNVQNIPSDHTNERSLPPPQDTKVADFIENPQNLETQLNLPRV